MSLTSDPGPQQPPADDSRAASIAWAVAAIVVAIVIGFIAWLALGDGGPQQGSGEGTPPTASAPAAGTETEAAQPPAAEDESPAESAEPDAAQTPSPEVQQLLLDLQRRDPDDPMAEGDVDAPVVMIEYADYRCPYCAQFHLEERPELQPLVDDGTLRIEFRDLVLFDEPSQQAAVAARAAAEQGLLGDYQTALFSRSSEGHAELEREDLVAIAEEVGVPDLAAFEAALDDEELDALVTADTEEARSIGLSSTPTFILNTAVVQGAYKAEHMIRVIEEQAELARAATRS